MSKRGWTDELIQETLDNPVRTVKTRDTRWLPGADGPLDGKLSTMSTIKRKNRHLLAIPIYLNLDI
ncbi:MAG: hypothetical protein IJ147_06320 [Lachnospiraceae bacterium]|nr:hypothetical protein [Lachnospiraceae bacterium]